MEWLLENKLSFLGASVLATSKKSLSTLEIPVIDATVTANQDPRAMINTAPPNSDVDTTMIIGIQVDIGIGPRNLIIRINPVADLL